ncbi:MAG TPA: hypothetical protein VNK04_03275, partial [Gemmataceae bacterium]|nr:hypothetical protein [Gemmataceae bacterium]
REGKLSAHDRGLNLTPDAANYFAWYCPEEKGFFDHRTQPFAHAVKDYVELREALMPAPEEVDEAVQQMQQEVIRGEPFPRRADLPWQKIFRARGIKYVLVHRMPHRVARWMLADPRQWTPLYLDGRVMILGWTDPAAPAPGATPFPELRFDPARLAFGPPGVATEAPAQGPEQPLQPPPREWWERYLRAAAPASLHADEVEMLLRYFEWQSQAHLVRLSWVGHCSFAAGLVGAAVPMPGPTAMPGLVACRLRFADDLLRGYFARHDDGPPGVLWLAVRAGRKALAENPNDPIAYLRLYRAYAMLQQHTRERSWADRMPLLRAVRRAQMMYCLKRAVTLNPDLAEAHATLAEMYRRMGFGDLALKHLDEFIRVIRHGGAAPEAPPGEFEERLKQVEADRDQLAEQVKKAQDEFLVGSAKMTQTLEKARFARDLGLPEEALKVLTPTIQQLSPEEAQFTLRLLVDLGELDVLRDVLTDKLSDLGLVRHEFQLLPAYEWFQVQLAAASGDYQRADELLQTIEDRFREQLLTLLGRHAQLFVLEPPALPMVPRVLGILTTRLQRVEAFSVLRQFPFSRPQQGDLVLLRGLLALEQGDTARAAQQIERSLAIAPTADYPSEPAATYFLQQLREQAVKKE